jgi:hypothetical protein
LSKTTIEWQRQLDAGEVQSQADIARREGITRSRVTQVMSTFRLAPEIQQQVLSLPDMVRRPAITERALRPIAGLENLAEQKAMFDELIQRVDPKPESSQFKFERMPLRAPVPSSAVGRGFTRH